MGYASRISKAASRGAKASRVFENLESEFLAAAQEAREVHDELQAEIDALRKLQEQAADTGKYNEARAVRVRETLL